MRPLRLAYRDQDRLVFMVCVQEMARRHYDVEVVHTRIQPKLDFEGALFNGACDAIIEHTEYLYPEAKQGAGVIMFCAPIQWTDATLVVPPSVQDVNELDGTTIAIRAQGRAEVTALLIKAIGLENKTTTVLVSDAEVGRWGQWRKVLSGECGATFMSSQYLPDAVNAGLKVLPTAGIPIVGPYSQACLKEFAEANDQLLEDYLRATIHAICLIKFRRDEALEIVLHQLADVLQIDRPEAARRLAILGTELSTTPYPPLSAIANSFEAACAEYPSSVGLDPLTVWDPKWVGRLEESGFITGIMQEMTTHAG